MKNRKLGIVLAILFIVGLVLLFLYAYPVDRFVEAPCPDCTTDVNTTTDCVAYLDKIKDNPQFMTVESSMGISNSNIQKVTKIVYNGSSVKCRYYGPSAPFL